MPESQRQLKHTKTKRTIGVYHCKISDQSTKSTNLRTDKIENKKVGEKTVDGVLDVKEFFGGKWGELFQNNPARHNGTAHISSVLPKCKILFGQPNRPGPKLSS